MRRNESGRPSMSGAGAVSQQDRIQPGRVMVVLKDALLPDEMVHEVAIRFGEIRSMHRPPNNQQLMFIQYADPSSAVDAIESLKNFPMFKAVDPALKSERFVEGNDGGRNDNQQHNKNSGMKNAQKQGGNKGYKDNSNMNGNYSKDSSFCFDEANGPQNLDMMMNAAKPDIPLGCQYCTKMPSFECHQCGAYYCDNNCQRMDWPRHKVICMPRLIPISYSNKRILQEAVASKQNSSLSGSAYGPTLVDSCNQAQLQQRLQQHQQQQQQQQNQFNRRGQTDAKKNQNNQPNQQNQQQNNQNKPKQQQQQKQNQSPNSSMEEAGGSSSKMNQLSNKLQRMKMSKMSNGSGASSSSAVKRILQPGQFPPEGSRVKITASLPSGVVYVYHNNGKTGDTSDYYQLTQKLFQAAGDAKPLNEVPKVDDVIFAPFVGGFYRGKVLAVNGDKVEVHYVDFGNSEFVQWKESKAIANEDLKWAKYLTFPVKLEAVGVLTNEMKHMLEGLEHTEEFELAKVAQRDNSPMKEVVLKRPKQTLTLNMELVELREKEMRLKREREERKEQERLQKEEKERERLEEERRAKDEQRKTLVVSAADPSNYKPVLYDESMEPKQLPLDSKQKIIIIDASELSEQNMISVIALDDVAEYGEIVMHCGIVGPKDRNMYRPTHDGEVCLVLYENDWTRALFSEGTFMLLDVGVMNKTVPENNVRRFPKGLSHVVYNNEVYVENLAMLSDIMTDDDPTTIHGKQIEAWVAASDDGISIRILNTGPK